MKGYYWKKFHTFITGGSNVEYNREHWKKIKIWCKQEGYLVGKKEKSLMKEDYKFMTF